jgi:protoheme IX farnesyltransferase
MKLNPSFMRNSFQKGKLWDLTAPFQSDPLQNRMMVSILKVRALPNDISLANVQLKDLVALTKPGVTGLVLFTAFTTYFAASGSLVSLPDALLLILAGGMAAAGSSALNHFLERDLDAEMPRTANRPLPSGRLANPKIALVWGTALATGGVLLAYLTLPLLAALFILLGVLIYIPLYTTFLKQRSVLNIVIGGAAGSCPVLAGWAVARADWPIVPFALAAAVFFWTPAHFWAFAMRYRTEYQLAGFPMLPNIVGPAQTTPYILGHAIMAVLASLIALRGIPRLIVGLTGFLFLLVSFRLWQAPTDRNAGQVYKYSNYYLLSVFTALMLI